MENSEFKQEAQYLTLSPMPDEKMWVAEIAGDDPTFRLKRIFLPQINPGVFEIYDGFYQVHGIYPGISPFEKEYCLVENGHMQRRLQQWEVIQQLPKIKAAEPLRQDRIKHQIKQLLKEIYQVVKHELVYEDLLYQVDQLDSLENSDQLMEALGQLIRQKDRMIEHYKKAIENYTDYY